MFCDIDKYVDQLTELYPRPKVAAEFKRKIRYPRTFSVYRRPWPRWPRLNLTLGFELAPSIVILFILNAQNMT